MVQQQKPEDKDKHPRTADVLYPIEIVVVHNEACYDEADPLWDGTRGIESFDDFNSRRSQVWDTGKSITDTITYDPLYRLTSSSISGGDLFQYTYDAIGNHLTETTTGGETINYAHDNANHLSSVEGVSYTWTKTVAVFASLSGARGATCIQTARRITPTTTPTS